MGCCMGTEAQETREVVLCEPVPKPPPPRAQPESRAQPEGKDNALVVLACALASQAVPRYRCVSVATLAAAIAAGRARECSSTRCPAAAILALAGVITCNTVPSEQSVSLVTLAAAVAARATPEPVYRWTSPVVLAGAIAALTTPEPEYRLYSPIVLAAAAAALRVDEPYYRWSAPVVLAGAIAAAAVPPTHHRPVSVIAVVAAVASSATPEPVYRWTCPVVLAAAIAATAVPVPEYRPVGTVALGGLVATVIAAMRFAPVPKALNDTLVQTREVEAVEETQERESMAVVMAGYGACIECRIVERGERLRLTARIDVEAEAVRGVMAVRDEEGMGFTLAQRWHLLVVNEAVCRRTLEQEEEASFHVLLSEWTGIVLLTYAECCGRDVEHAIVAADREARGAYTAVEEAIRYEVAATALTELEAFAPVFIDSQRTAVSLEESRLRNDTLAEEGASWGRLLTQQLSGKLITGLCHKHRTAGEARRERAFVAACHADMARLFEQFVVLYKISADLLYNAAQQRERALLRGAINRYRHQEVWDRTALIAHALNTPKTRLSTADALARLGEYPMPEYDLPVWDDPHPLDGGHGGIVAAFPSQLSLPSGWFHRVADTIECLPVYELAPRGLRDILYTLHSDAGHWVLRRTRFTADAAHAAPLHHHSLVMLRSAAPHSGLPGDTPSHYTGAWEARGGDCWLDTPSVDVWDPADGVVLIPAALRPRDCVFSEHARWCVDATTGAAAPSNDLLAGVLLSNDLEVLGVARGSIAERAGLVEGSFVIMTNGIPVKTPDDVQRALDSVPTTSTQPPRITIEPKSEPPAACTSTDPRPREPRDTVATEAGASSGVKRIAPGAPRPRRASMGCSVARWRRGIAADDDREDSFRERLLRLWHSKPGTVVEELATNGVFPAGGEPLLIVSTAATEVMKNRGLMYPNHNSVELLVMALYTMAGPDIDRLYGFRVPLYDASNPSEWHAYQAHFRDRNRSIAVQINAALRTAYTAVGPAADDAWMTVGRWVKFIGILLGLGSMPMELSADPFLASPFETDTADAVLVRGLEGMPQGVVDEHLQVAGSGGTLVWPAAASCTRNHDAAIELLNTAADGASIATGTPMCFVIGGVGFGLPLQDVSQYPVEDEVLLPPLSRLRITRAVVGGDGDGAVVGVGNEVPVIHVQCAAAGVGEGFQVDARRETADACVEACQMVQAHWRKVAPPGSHVEVLCPRSGWSPMRRASVAARRASKAAGEGEFPAMPDYISTGGLSFGRKPLWYAAEVVRYVEDRLTVVVRFLGPEKGGAEIPLDPACMRPFLGLAQSADDYIEARLADVLRLRSKEVRLEDAKRISMYGRAMRIRVRTLRKAREARRQIGVWRVEACLAAIASHQLVHRLTQAKALRLRRAANRIKRSWTDFKMSQLHGQAAAAVAIQRLWRGHAIRRQAVDERKEREFKALLGTDLEDGWEEHMPDSYFDECEALGDEQAAVYRGILAEEQEAFAVLSKFHLELMSKRLIRDAAKKREERLGRPAAAPLRAELLDLEADKLAKSRALLARHHKIRAGKLAEHNANVENLTKVIVGCMGDAADMDSALHTHFSDTTDYKLAKVQADVNATLAGMHRASAERRTHGMFKKIRGRVKVPAGEIPVSIPLNDAEAEEVILQAIDAAENPDVSCFAGHALPRVALVSPEHMVFLPPDAGWREDPLLPHAARDWVQKGAVVSAFTAIDPSSAAPTTYAGVYWNNCLRVLQWTPRRLWAKGGDSSGAVYTSPVLCGGTWADVIAFPVQQRATSVGVAYLAPATGAFGVSVLELAGSNGDNGNNKSGSTAALPPGGPLRMAELLPQAPLDGCGEHRGLCHAVSRAAPGVHYFLACNEYITEAAVWCVDFRNATAPTATATPVRVPLLDTAAGTRHVTLSCVGAVANSEPGIVQEALAVTACGLTCVAVFRVDAVFATEADGGGGDGGTVLSAALPTFTGSHMHCKLQEPASAAVVAAPPTAAEETQAQAHSPAESPRSPATPHSPGTPGSTSSRDVLHMVFARLSGTAVVQRIPAMTAPLPRDVPSQHKPFLVSAGAGVLRTVMASRVFTCMLVEDGATHAAEVVAVPATAAAVTTAATAGDGGGASADGGNAFGTYVHTQAHAHPLLRGHVAEDLLPLRLQDGSTPSPSPATGLAAAVSPHARRRLSSVTWASRMSGERAGSFNTGPRGSLSVSSSRPTSASLRDRLDVLKAASRPASAAVSERTARSGRTLATDAPLSPLPPPKLTVPERKEVLGRVDPVEQLVAQWRSNLATLPEGVPSHDMADTELTDAAARGLLQALPMMHGLKALDVSQNLLTDAFVEELLPVLRYTSLTEIKYAVPCHGLSHNLLTETSVILIADALDMNNKLLALRLEGNDFEEADVPDMRVINEELAARNA